METDQVNLHIQVIGLFLPGHQVKPQGSEWSSLYVYNIAS